jgi:tetraacyldisaccharide 4'-kinase
MDNHDYAVRYPRGRRALVTGLQRRLRPALIPASWLYAAIGDTARRLRSLERRPSPPDVTVISVGNLEAGGSGKTPLCIHLLERAVAEGKPAAYVSRGYGARAERFDGVTIVGRWPGQAEQVRWLPRDAPYLAAEVGDEGAVVAGRVPGAVLAFSRDKAAAVDLVAPAVRGGVVVLDDAFQSWAVARDVDVVLLDSTRPFGDGWLLPAGSLRESAEALGRADIVVLNGAADDRVAADVRARVRRIIGRDIPCARMERRVDPGVAAGEHVVVASAIARPEAFERSIAAHGITVETALRFPDHHHFVPTDVEAIRDACAGRLRCVVTEKDWVKLRGLGCSEPEFAVARLQVTVDDVAWWGTQEEPRPGSRGSRGGAGS